MLIFGHLEQEQLLILDSNLFNSLLALGVAMN